nr:immunoglobulin light chain junction region [Mus musculus]
CQQWSSYPYTF